MTILGERGQAGLKIAPLCRELGVTSGSFYHHFGSWAGFVEAMLTHWEAEQTQTLLALTWQAEDPWERVTVMKNLAVTVPHEAEAAIRAWGKLDPAVGHAQQRVDAARIEGLRVVVAGVGGDDATARRLSLMGIALLAGVQQIRGLVDREELLGVLNDFEQVIAANVPTTAGAARRS
jgi:AcrR family transcriptional regulator